jgi:DNA-binding response OmpR family regulator
MENNSHKKVVLIEDDAMLGGIILNHLRAELLDAKLITTGTNAFEALKADVPEVIVLDIFLPGVNGIELLEMIRKDDATKNIKVLVVSNSSENKHRDIVTNLGASFMVKAAVNPAFIVAQVKKMLAS